MNLLLETDYSGKRYKLQVLTKLIKCFRNFIKVFDAMKQGRKRKKREKEMKIKGKKETKNGEKVTKICSMCII